MRLIPLFRAPVGLPYYSWSLIPLTPDQPPDEWVWCDDAAKVTWYGVDKVYVLAIPGRASHLFAHECFFMNHSLDLPLAGGPVKPESE